MTRFPISSQTKFNGWKAGGGATASHWETFVQANQHQLAKLFRQLAAPDTNVGKEFDDLLDKIGDEALRSKWQKLLQLPKEERTFERMSALFGEVMEQQHAHLYRPEVGKRFSV